MSMDCSRYTSHEFLIQLGTSQPYTGLRALEHTDMDQINSTDILERQLLSMKMIPVLVYVYVCVYIYSSEV